MRNTLTLIIGLLFLNGFLNAQSNSSLRFLGGIKNSTSWQGSQSYNLADIDAFLEIKKTSPINLASYFFIYSHKISSKWALDIGVSFNKKGFKATGLLHDFPRSILPYEGKRIQEYGGFLIGGQCNFHQKGSWKFNIELLLNPEFERLDFLDMRKSVVSTIALLIIEKQINDNLSVSLNPFFETALMKYNKPSSSTFQYTPYGYGLKLGLQYSISP